MKKTLLLTAAVLSAVFTFAQNPAGSRTNENPWNNRPDVVIKGNELKNFPGGQLTEMLLGRLPGLDQVNLQAAEYQVVYVVDGFVWPAIDLININNIEEIAYYRGGLNSKLGVQNNSAAGLIYITTKTARFKQPFNASVNTLLGYNSIHDGDKKDHTTLQSYNLVLGEGFEQFSWRASAVYNQNTRNLSALDFTHQYQLNADFRYSPLNWLDLGINVNYAPLKGESPVNSKVISAYFSLDDQAKLKQDNWNGFFYAKVKPLQGLINETRILKNNLVSDQDYYSNNYDSGPTFNTQNNTIVLQHNKYTNFSVLNDLSYRFSLNEDQIRVKAGSNFQFNDLKYYSGSQYEFNNAYNGTVSRSSNFYETWSQAKLYTLSADLSLTLYDILSLEAGVRSDKYKGLEQNSHYSPYYYAGLSLKQVFLKELSVVNEVLLFGSYGQYLTGVGFQGFPSYSNLTFNNIQVDEKMKTQSMGLKTSFFNNRFQLSGDWFRDRNYTLSLIVPPNGNPYNYLSKTKREGWRIWASAAILKETKVKWNTGVNIFRNKFESNALDGIVVSNPIETDKQGLQAGSQQNLSYANCFLDMSAYAYFNHPFYAPNNTGNQVGTKATFLNLNYLALGYNFKDQLTGCKTLKNLSVSLLGRNLMQYKKKVAANPVSKTFGIALNASF